MGWDFSKFLVKIDLTQVVRCQMMTVKNEIYVKMTAACQK